MKEQIEEIKQVIATAIKNYLEENGCLALHIRGRKNGTSTKLITEALYNAGYRKESETAKEIFSLLLSDEYICYFDVAVVKEIAEKYNIQI